LKCISFASKNVFKCISFASKEPFSGMLWVQEGLFSCEKKYHHAFEMRDQYYIPKTHFSQYSELEILGINKNSQKKKFFFGETWHFWI
jgi:hypothetical protein